MGRPKKQHSIDHVVSTRVTDEQFKFIRHYAHKADLSIGTALRQIVERCRKDNLER